MRILTTKVPRSLIAQELRKNGEFQKVKGKYIQGDLEICFLDSFAITEEHIKWADVICGYFYNPKLYDLIIESNKLTNMDLLTLIKFEIYGYEELWQIITRNSNMVSNIDFEIKKVKVLSYEVERLILTKKYFKTEEEAINSIYEIIENKINEATMTIKRLKEVKSNLQKSYKGEN